jgi:hypothetical protein
LSRSLASLLAGFTTDEMRLLSSKRYRQRQRQRCRRRIRDCKPAPFCALSLYPSLNYRYVISAPCFYSVLHS